MQKRYISHIYIIYNAKLKFCNYLFASIQNKEAEHILDIHIYHIIRE